MPHPSCPSHVHHGDEETASMSSCTKAGRFKEYVSQGVNGGDMTDKATSKNDDLTSLPGVGAATAKKLKAAKLTSIGLVAKATPSKLQKAGLSVAVASNVLKAAKAASTVKKAAASSKEKAKSSAKKAASKTKKTAQKAKAASKKATQKVMEKSQKVAEKVVENTTTTTSLKTKKEDDRKGDTIKVPRSVKDMPWFKKR